jgi:hypothetical protein
MKANNEAVTKEKCASTQRQTLEVLNKQWNCKQAQKAIYNTY